MIIHVKAENNADSFSQGELLKESHYFLSHATAIPISPPYRHCLMAGKDNDGNEPERFIHVHDGNISAVIYRVASMVIKVS
jgi:hypothetical protein